MRLESDELIFEEFSDKDDVFDSYCECLRDYENVKMIGRHEYLLSTDISEIKEYVYSLNRSSNDSFFAVKHKIKGGGVFIGTLKIGHINWRIGTGDLGIMIGNKEYRGKGLSEKICKMGLEYAFHILGLRRMSCGCYEKNIPMCRCFEKIGFKKIGVERENVTFEGEYCNHVLYDMLRTEWEELNNVAE
ncbi:MAG: GNAT family N-acetyltransferase [Lachnospiraceae bacterium]|nr:GNAT family N-acetyltransferase [Lachnospiraceae bacterium]